MEKIGIDDFLTIAAQRRLQREEVKDTNEIGAIVTSSDSRPASYRLTCPRCRTMREMCRTWLYRNGKPCTVRCKACHRTASSRRWTCSCGISWTSCTVHRADGFLCEGMARLRKKCKDMHENSFFLTLSGLGMFVLSSMSHALWALPLPSPSCQLQPYHKFCADTGAGISGSSSSSSTTLPKRSCPAKDPTRTRVFTRPSPFEKDGAFQC